MSGEGVLRPRRILVTGGTGFVGQHLIRALRDGWADDVAFVIGGRGEPGTDIHLDLARPETIAQAVAAAAPDMVLHLAGEASVATAANAAADTWRLNVAGTLELAAAFGLIRPDGVFFFTSSAEVYGRAFLGGVVSEATPPVPDTVYGRSKLAAERMLADVLPAAARLIVVRPSNHIGPGQDERFATPSFARQLADAEAAGRPATIRVGNLAAERDFMDVRDVVRAYAGLLALDLVEGARETVNVSSGTPRSVRSLLDTMRAEACIKSVVVVDPARFRVAEIARAAVDSRRIAALTGWRPEIPIERSLRDVLTDARERRERVTDRSGTDSTR